MPALQQRLRSGANLSSEETMIDAELVKHLQYGCNLQQRDGELAARRILELRAALEHARDSLLWCARGGRMASHGLEQYPEKWAASATAVLEQRG